MPLQVAYIENELVVGSTTMKVDTANNTVGINTTTPSEALDVSGNTNITGVYKITGNTIISSNGIVTIGGTNVYFPEVENDFYCFIPPRTTCNYANLVDINGTGVWGYDLSNNSSKEISFLCQLDHTWAEGTQLTPHFHWLPSNANTSVATFYLDYWMVNMGEAVTGVTTLTANTNPSGAFKHTLTAFPPVTTTGKTASFMFGGRIYRPTGDAFTGDAVVVSVDIHGKRNRWGYNTA